MTPTTRSGLAVVAATLLGASLVPGSQWVRVGFLVPVVVLAALAALGGSRLNRLSASWQRLLGQMAFWIGMFLFARSLIRALNMTITSHVALFGFGMIICGGAAIAVVIRHGGNLPFGIFLGTYLIVSLGVLAVTRDGAPHIDVVVFQQDASEALLDGQNPYAMTFPDLYTPEESERYYGPGISVDGELQFGYPYLPLSLLAVAPFELLLGDFRIAHALALVGAALIMSRIRPGHASRQIAILFLLVSPVFYIITFGWIEPLLILAAAAVVLGASRQPRVTPYLTGLFLSLKQYSALLVPVSLLLIERPWRMRVVVAWLGKAAAVVAATAVPFFLWGPGEFMWSVVELQYEQPFRPDSISLMAAWAELFGQPGRLVTSLVPLLLVAAASIAALYRTPTGGQGFALAAALTLLAAFTFSKQAFANYYILVIGMLMIGAAAGAAPGDEPESDPEKGRSKHLIETT